jgi:hypothetical protein
MTGFIATYSHSSGLQAIQRYRYSTHFTVQRCIRTRVLSVFTSRIMATDLSQSHCNFKSHVKSSYHNLIHFLLLFCKCQFRRLYSIQFQAHILRGWRPETGFFAFDYCTLLLLLFCLFKWSSLSLYKPSARTTWKKPVLLRRSVYWSVA